MGTVVSGVGTVVSGEGTVVSGAGTGVSGVGTVVVGDNVVSGVLDVFCGVAPHSLARAVLCVEVLGLQTRTLEVRLGVEVVF